MNKLTLQLLPQEFCVCQVADYSEVNPAARFTFTATTDEELSVVCPTDSAPAHTLQREDGWAALRICGVLDFSLIGILADIAGRLAKQHISIFALSTYNTDYVLIKKDKVEEAVKTLEPHYIFA